MVIFGREFLDTDGRYFSDSHIAAAFDFVRLILFRRDGSHNR